MSINDATDNVGSTLGIINLVGDDGISYPCEHLATLSLDGTKYLALSDLHETDEADETDESDDVTFISFLRVATNPDGTDVYKDDVPDDVIDKLFDMLTNILEDQDADEDDLDDDDDE